MLASWCVGKVGARVPGPILLSDKSRVQQDNDSQTTQNHCASIVLHAAYIPVTHNTCFWTLPFSQHALGNFPSALSCRHSKRQSQSTKSTHNSLKRDLLWMAQKRTPCRSPNPDPRQHQSMPPPCVVAWHFSIQNLEVHLGWRQGYIPQEAMPM
jgi:hypothetical protein